MYKVYHNHLRRTSHAFHNNQSDEDIRQSKTEWFFDIIYSLTLKNLENWYVNFVDLAGDFWVKAAVLYYTWTANNWLYTRFFCDDWINGFWGLLDLLQQMLIAINISQQAHEYSVTTIRILCIFEVTHITRLLFLLLHCINDAARGWIKYHLAGKALTVTGLALWLQYSDLLQDTYHQSTRHILTQVFLASVVLFQHLWYYFGRILNYCFGLYTWVHFNPKHYQDRVERLVSLILGGRLAKLFTVSTDAQNDPRMVIRVHSSPS